MRPESPYSPPSSLAPPPTAPKLPSPSPPASLRLPPPAPWRSSPAALLLLLLLLRSP
jgi:hypothetical protein